MSNPAHPKRAEIVKAIWKGAIPGEVAFEFGVSLVYTYKIYPCMDMAKRYVTEAEYQSILKARPENPVIHSQ